MELPDWLRGIVLLGKDGDEYRVVGVDADGYLGAILKAAAAVTIADNVTVEQDDSIRQVQGAEGANLRTIAVDANGQIIMVPRGAGGNYMAVDGDGFLTALMRGYQAGVGQHDIAVDADGQMIMVPRGSDGNYLTVDTDGHLSANLLGESAGEPIKLTADANGILRARLMGIDGVTVRTVKVDAAGQIIMVPRGSTGNYMAVDANGYMTTVIKGTYGAILKTLGADDDGYLIAMLKDGEDQWGEKISVGLGELAARLGSPISWDRRGQVVKMQTFVDGLGYCVGSSSGAGSSDGLDTGVFQTGKQSYKLTTGTDGSKSASITLYSDYPPAGRLGFEVTFSMASQPDDIYLLAKIWDGTLEYHGYARIHKATTKLQVYNSDPAYEDVSDFALPAVPQLFCSVKIVVDVVGALWERLLVRGTEYDLSDVVMDTSVVAVHPYLTFQILAIETGVVSHTIYVDRMIVTSNEP